MQEIGVTFFGQLPGQPIQSLEQRQEIRFRTFGANRLDGVFEFDKPQQDIFLKFGHCRKLIQNQALNQRVLESRAGERSLNRPPTSNLSVYWLRCDKGPSS